MIHTIALYGSAALVGVLFSGILLGLASLSGRAQSSSDYELCQEVREEVSLAVESGLLSQDEADQITDRCFTEPNFK